jgi:hypothetical protein
MATTTNKLQVAFVYMTVRTVSRQCKKKIGRITMATTTNNQKALEVYMTVASRQNAGDGNLSAQNLAE